MAKADDYANWLVKNESLKGTEDFNTVARAYEAAKVEEQATSKQVKEPLPRVANPTTGQYFQAAGKGFVGELAKGAGALGQLVGADQFGEKALDWGKQQVAEGDAISPIATGAGQIGSYILPGGAATGAVRGTVGATRALSAGAKGTQAVSQAGNVARSSTPLLTAPAGVVSPASALTRQQLMSQALRGPATTKGLALEQGAINAALGFGTTEGDLGERATAGAIGGVAGGTLPLVGKGIQTVLGGTTGTGKAAIEQAYQAGRAGPTSQASMDFIENLRKGAKFQDIVPKLEANLQQMQKNASKEYLETMSGANKIARQTPLKFDDIDDALKNAGQYTHFEGQVIKKGAADKVDEVAKMVDEWKALDPAQYHRAAGMDALKRKVGDVLETIPYEEKGARKAVGDIYQSINNTIGKQVPEYAQATKGYAQAMEELAELRHAFSIKDKQKYDATLRRLQSVMRDNVNTNYGNRTDLLNTAIEKGGINIMPHLAGQSLSSGLPRGIWGSGAVPTSILAGVSGLGPAGAGLLAASSPRLVGEAAYLAGRGANLASKGGVAADVLRETAKTGSVQRSSKGVVEDTQRQKEARQRAEELRRGQQ